MEFFLSISRCMLAIKAMRISIKILYAHQNKKIIFTFKEGIRTNEHDIRRGEFYDVFMENPIFLPGFAGVAYEYFSLVKYFMSRFAYFICEKD